MGKKNLDKQLELLKQEAEDLKVKEAEAKAREAEIAKEECKVKIAEDVKPYNVFGRSFSVTEPSVVAFYKNRFELLVIQYKLMGSFDEDGRYSIPREIKYDLIEMKKEIEEMGDDYYKVSALYMKKYFNFTIKLSMVGDGKAKASLSLAEYVGKSTDDEIIYTHIADFVDVFDADFRIKLRKAFNLVDVDALNDDASIPTLAVLMQDLFDIDMYIGELYDMASQIYLIRMIELLENGGELEQEVLAYYRKLLAQYEAGELAGYEFGINGKHRNQILKELLDKAIDSFGGLEKLSIKKKERDIILGEFNKTSDAIDKLSDKCKGATVIEEVNLPDKEKGSSGGKSGGSSKKKAKPKKKDGDKKAKPKKKDKKDKKDDDKKKKSGGGVAWESFGTPEFDAEEFDFGVDTNPIDVPDVILIDDQHPPRIEPVGKDEEKVDLEKVLNKYEGDSDEAEVVAGPVAESEEFPEEGDYSGIQEVQVPAEPAPAPEVPYEPASASEAVPYECESENE